MASLAHCNSLDNSSEDYEVIPDDAPDTVVPFQCSSRSRSCSPFSRILPKAFGRKDAEPPHERAVEQHSDKGPDKEELRAVAAAVSWEGGVSTHKHQGCNTHISDKQVRRRNIF